MYNRQWSREQLASWSAGKDGDENAKRKKKT